MANVGALSYCSISRLNIIYMVEWRATIWQSLPFW